MKTYIFGGIAILIIGFGMWYFSSQSELMPEIQTAKPGDVLLVHYEGRLEDGKVFDSSYERGTPFKFTLGAGKVIAGWDQGVQGMAVGEKKELVIPPELGYGEEGRPPIIPPNATLYFTVELVAIQ